jgi:hypothetical protein
MSKREFKTITEKATYSLPIYTLDNSGLVKTDKDFEIKFLKGDRRGIPTKEEYDEATKQLDHIAPYLGKRGRKFAIHLGQSSIDSYEKEWSINEDIVKRFETPIFTQDGIVIEAIIPMLIEHLTNVNKDVPSRETSVAITKLQEALFWLEERQRDREARNVAGTYQK